MNGTLIGIYQDEDEARLKRTLDALRSYTPEVQEILLLGDGAPISTPFGERVGITPLSTPDRVGSSACFNRLLNYKLADVYVFLEGGAEVGPGWLERLLVALWADPRNGLAGPSTNRSWNEQAAFPRATPGEVRSTAGEAARRFGNTWRTLEPLYSLADFCYVVRREVIEDIGLADEAYGTGPCWEMDYNIRAARAGWHGVWVCGAYVHRMPFSRRRAREEARLFETNKRRYQRKFCAGHLRGVKHDFRGHCRGDACPNFAPAHLIEIRHPPSPTAVAAATTAASVIAEDAVGELAPIQIDEETPLVTCIMPTADRAHFVPEAVRLFLRQDYPKLELLVVDDGATAIDSLLPKDPRIRLLRLPAKKNIGAKRNIACSIARGRFVVHWDDDDWYPADRVTRQVRALQESGAELCGTSVIYYCDLEAQQAWCYRYRASGRGWVAGNTLAYGRSWWSRHPFPEMQIGEDTRFVWSAPRSALRDLKAPELCIGRIHPGNTSRKNPREPSWSTCGMEQIQTVLGKEWPLFTLIGRSTCAAKGAPLVSCIMPTFNRRAYLPLALAAFQSQDYPAKELIVVDDGADSVRDLVEPQPHARYFRLEGRRSIGAKRNFACAQASGPIVAHWDDDDWYAPQRLRRQTAPLLAGEADMSGLHDSLIFDTQAGCLWKIDPQLHRRMFVGDVHGGTLVFWKRLLKEGLSYPAANIAEDATLLRAAQRRGKRLARIPNDGLFIYMRHGRNAWRFEPGRFLTATGWHAVEPPVGFSPAELLRWQAAAQSS